MLCFINSKLHIGEKCLALHEDDDVWYPATVIELENDIVTVLFEDSNKTSIPLQNILPLGK